MLYTASAGTLANQGAPFPPCHQVWRRNEAGLPIQGSDLPSKADSHAVVQSRNQLMQLEGHAVLK